MNILLNSKIDIDKVPEYPIYVVYFINACVIIFWLWVSVKQIGHVLRVCKGIEITLWISLIILLPLLGNFITYHYFSRKS